MVQWHLDTSSPAYRDLAAAERAARWLNMNHHAHEAWLYRAAEVTGAYRLERRWVGTDANANEGGEYDLWSG